MSVELDRLCQSIHAFARADVAWDEVGHAIARQFKAHNLILLTLGDEGDVRTVFDNSFIGITKENLVEYKMRYEAIDPFPGSMMKLQKHSPKDNLTANLRRIYPDEKNYLNSEMFNSYYKYIDLHHAMLAKSYSDMPLLKRNMFTVLHRGHRSEDFSVADEAMLAFISSHLMRAVETTMRGQYAITSLHAVLEAKGQVQQALVLADRLGREVHSNTLAQALFAQNDGLALRSRHIVLHDAAAQSALSAAIDGALGLKPRSAIVVPRPSGRLPFIITVDALPSAPRAMFSLSPVGAPALLVSIIDPDRAVRPADRILAQLFKLTKAETAVAVKLADGLPPAIIAEEMGRSVTTVRSHIQSIFLKTGCSRQSDLIRIMSRLPEQAP